MYAPTTAMSGWPVPGSGTRARISSMKSSGVRATNAGEVTASMSVVDPSASANLTAKPRPSRVWSGDAGSPLAFEKRATTGIVSPLRWPAVVSAEPSGVAVKTPARSAPFACNARAPSWVPVRALTESMMSAAMAGRSLTRRL